MSDIDIDNSPAARRERFTVVLAGQFEQPQFAMAAAKHGGPRPYAERFVAGLIDGSADHSGTAVQATMRALGIKRTVRALREFLTAEVRS